MTNFEMRFWSKVRIGDGCWEWFGSKNEWGYGQTWMDRRAIETERVPDEKTSASCIPGYRRVFGQTFHFGPLKVFFGAQRARGQGEP